MKIIQICNSVDSEGSEYLCALTDEGKVFRLVEKYISAQYSNGNMVKEGYHIRYWAEIEAVFGRPDTKETKD